MPDNNQLVVFKYRVDVTEPFITVPRGRILPQARMSTGASEDGHVIEFWVEHPDPDKDNSSLEGMTVGVVGTGHRIPPVYRAATNVFDGIFVWHIVTDTPDPQKDTK